MLKEPKLDALDKKAIPLYYNIIIQSAIPTKVNTEIHIIYD